MRFIRHFLADDVVFQSNFVKEWWYSKFGPSKCTEHVIYNAAPQIAEAKADCEKTSLVSVEGNVANNPVTEESIIRTHRELFSKKLITQTEICGGIDNSLKQRLETEPGIIVHGAIPKEELFNVLNRARLFLCLEIMPPCPNSVLEALAFGIPILGFDTGCLKELALPIPEAPAGELVEYEGDPWSLQSPRNIEQLATKARQIIENEQFYRGNAKTLASSRFHIDTMTDKYLSVIKN